MLDPRGSARIAVLLTAWLVGGMTLPAAAGPVHPDRPHRWGDTFATPGRCITGAAAGDGLLYLADREADVIYAVDPASGEVRRELPTPGPLPRGLAHDGTHLWVADGKEALIYRLDPTDGTSTLRFEAPSSNVAGLAHDGMDLWVADSKANQIHQLSALDGTAITTIPAPATRVTGLAWDGLYLWAADRIADEIYRVDGANGDVVLTLQAGGEHSWGLAWHGGQLYNADYQSDRVFSLAPADLPTYALLEDRSERIFFHHEIRNYGPEPLKQATIAIAIPRNRPGLELLQPAAFEPAPTETGKDSWGQEIARFQFDDVSAPDKVGAVMTLEARTWTVRYYLMPEKIGTLDDIPKKIRNQYLVDGDKYRIDDPIIQKTVQQVVGDETNAYKVMRALYDHLLEKMHYELSGGWNVAPAVLERGNGSCSEYTFVFIALCRAAGLPARYVGSVVRRYDDAAVDEIFHRWAEIYLPSYGWVPVDPSRGDKATPALQAVAIGQLDNGLVVTTESGGNSEDLGWTYNSASALTVRGAAKIDEEVYAEWELLAPAEDP